jgi:hypothetical protein
VFGEPGRLRPMDDAAENEKTSAAQASV